MRVLSGFMRFANWCRRDHSRVPSGVPRNACSLLAILCGTTLVLQSAVGGDISGMVTAEADGTPLQNVSVTAYRWDGSGWDSVNQEYTDSEGIYQVGGLIAGTYRVVFNDWNGGYLSEIYDNVVGDSPYFGGADIGVPPATTVSNINASLAMGSIITGLVTAEADGTPLQNVSVTAYRWDGSSLDGVSWGSTDVDGRYEINGLAAGTYRIHFSEYMTGQYIGETYDGLLDIWPGEGGTDIDVPGGGTTVSNINASLQTYVSISGTATDAGSGQPVQGVRVYLHDTWRSAVSDSAGNYTISRILPGTYYLRANPDASTGLLGAWLGGPLYAGQQTPPAGATTVTATGGQTILDVDFPLERGAHISGVVQGESRPLPGARLKAINADYETTRRTVTDDLGQYDLAGLLPGTYTLKVEADGFADEWWDGMRHQSEAVPFALVVGEETTMNFDLSAGQSPALLEVISDPSGAEIYLDYWPTGTSTPAVINLGEVGNQDWAGYRLASHVISLKKEGEPRPPPQIIPAAEAETVVMQIDLLSTVTGSVSIATIPAGADVYVDYADQPEGVTPITVETLSPGSHTILLRKSGYLQPRPITAWVLENQTTAVEVPLVLDTATNRTMTHAQSVPQGIQIYVDYLPSGQVTDAVVDLMDPASHAGAGWHSASHTILLRHEGVPPMAARIVPEVADNLPAMMIHLRVDTEDAMDSSGDGIPDWLWQQYGYNPTNPPALDAIADVSGMTFGNKLRAGLVPGDPNSTFKVANVEMTQGPDLVKTITFVFRTVPGRRYLVQARERLMEGSWITISNVINATDYETTFAAQSEPGMEHLYYRLLVLDLY